MEAFHRADLCRFQTIWREGPVTGPMGSGPTHENPGYELTWVHAGVLAFDLGDGRRRVTTTTDGCILLPPGLRNTPHAAGSLHQVMLSPVVLAEAASSLAGSERAPREARVLAPGSRTAAIAAVIGRERRDVGDDDPIVESLVDALAVSLVRPDPPARAPLDAQISRAREYLHAHHGDALRIDDVARAVGLPRFVLMRRFKAQVGTSILAYLITLRLERAAHALRTTTGSVLDIALANGFSDPSRFARAFARRYGATPRAWRARSA